MMPKLAIRFRIQRALLQITNLPDGDPAAKDVGRTEFNQLNNDMTTELQKWQQFGVPDYITAADNGGTAFSYNFGVRVRDPATGTQYDSIVDNNTALLTDTASWREFTADSSAFKGALVSNTGSSVE